MGETISFAANGGTCGGYLAKAGRANAPGVVVLQEWWGVNGQIKRVADRFAEAGYTALVPDLYHGKVAREPDEAGKLMMAINIEQAAKDLRGAVNYLREATGKPVGTVGFCMGGAMSLFAAAGNGDAVGACVDFYGGHPAVKPNLDGLTAPVLGLFAGKDGFVNPEAVKQLDEALTAKGKAHEFHTYPNADHAFFNEDRPEVYDAEASADAWRRVMAFYKAHIG